MNIRGAESRTGISSKTIRYYEEAQLLTIERNKKTGYRIFDEEAINILKKIKLYRGIGIPIQEIKLILNKTVLPSEVLLRQKQELESQIRSMQMKKELLLSVINNDQMNNAEKELIYDVEDIIYCNPSCVQNKLQKLDRHTIILASLGASPQVNEFLQKLLPELDFKEEQKKLGRIQISDIEEAQVKMIIHINNSK